MSARFSIRLVLAPLTILVLLTGPGEAPGRDVAGNWGVGLEGGLMKLTEGRWDYSNLDQYFGIGVDRSLASRWDLRMSYQYGHVRHGVGAPGLDAGWSFESGAPYYTLISHPAISLLHRFRPDGFLCPKAGLGVGLTSWKVLNLRGKDVGLFPSGDPVEAYDIDGNAATLEGTDFTLTMETGLDAFLSENLALTLGARWHWTPGIEKDNIGASDFWGPDHVDANTGRVDLCLGLTWWFGSRDRDHDGVLDVDDLCPDHPEDFDGFRDQDGCPDPDNDGDRIVDEKDACPDEPEDFDGFQDQDGCPDPDNDEDGVPDELDQCPATPARTVVDRNGCPVAKEIKQDLVLEGVSFLTGSAELTPESLAILIGVAESLLAWPEVEVEIRGHTDSAGTPEGNRDLSHRRALAVRDSLIHLGVAPSRLNAVGYGEDYPLADNGTAEGRRINRRVEIHKVD